MGKTVDVRPTYIVEKNGITKRYERLWIDGRYVPDPKIKFSKEERAALEDYKRRIRENFLRK